MVSVVVTYITRSPIGIITGLLVGVFVELTLSFFIIQPHPKLKFEKDYVKKIFNRGKWVTASSIFDYLFYNTDNIAVGRILGAKALGIYQMGYSLATVPLSEVGKVFVHVAVPIMVRIYEDKPRLRSAFFKMVLSISLITLPFAFIFALIPHVFVAILGERWAAIAAILPILGVLGFVKSVSSSSFALFLSAKKQEYTTMITLVNILGLIISIVPLIMSYGVFGAGLSALIGSISAVPFIFYFVYKTLNHD